MALKRFDRARVTDPSSEHFNNYCYVLEHYGTTCKGQREGRQTKPFIIEDAQLTPVNKLNQNVNVRQLGGGARSQPITDTPSGGGSSPSPGPEPSAPAAITEYEGSASLGSDALFDFGNITGSASAEFEIENTGEGPLVLASLLLEDS